MPRSALYGSAFSDFPMLIVRVSILAGVLRNDLCHAFVVTEARVHFIEYATAIGWFYVWYVGPVHQQAVDRKSIYQKYFSLYRTVPVGIIETDLVS